MKSNLSAEQFSAALHDMKACDEARKWVEGLDYNTAWKTCGNPGWMFFLIKKVAPFTVIVNELLVCRFAREVVHLTDDPRVLACIEVREAWVLGKATDEERAAARGAARGAAWDASEDATAAAAWAAGWNASRVAAQSADGVTARDAAQSAAEAAAVIATAFVTELDEEWDTAYDVATKTARAKQCDIIRELVTQPELA